MLQSLSTHLGSPYITFNIDTVSLGRDLAETGWADDKGDQMYCLGPFPNGPRVVEHHVKNMESWYITTNVQG